VAAAYDYDLFVLGAGSGGVRAARLAAQSGARVAIAEADRVGGTCVIRGCIPKKFMVYASAFAAEFASARGYGWTLGETRFDWDAFREARDREVARLSGLYVANLNNAGVDILQARAELLGPHEVALPSKGLTLTADKILIATGGAPWRPDLPGIEHALVSDEIFDLPRLPRRLTVVGGGYIAVEFAGVFNGLGVETTLVHRGANILRGFDEDLRAHLAEEMERRGVKIVLGQEPVSLEKQGETIRTRLSGGRVEEAEVVLFATGRRPATANLGLERAGVRLAPSGAVEVDAASRTTVDSIFAIGDVTDRLNLTPVAIREAHAFVDTAYHGKPTAFDHANVPCAVFSQPPVGTVGLTEAEARHRGGAVDIYRSAFRPMKGTLYGGAERALLKLVVDRESQKVLGAHMVGPDAPEIIQMAAIAVKMGATKAQWDEACAVHPTTAEEFVTLRTPAPDPAADALS
jgi:glutathione reductase (NADPH)